MAMMVVRIEDRSTLKMNEFFDYNGRCWALSGSRSQTSKVGAELEDFYECTVRTDKIEHVPVVFVCSKDGQEPLKICGWYKEAVIYRKVLYPALFLEGNICARTTDAVLLKESQWKDLPGDFCPRGWQESEKLYKVVEADCESYFSFQKIIRSAKIGEPVSYSQAPSFTEKTFLAKTEAELRKVYKKSPPLSALSSMRYDHCIDYCAEYAQRLMSDTCESISDIKTLREYAQMAVTFGSNKPDGYYYKAMADEQLGFIKEGLKTVGKALEIEPDGADIIALKANLIAGLGKYSEAAQLYEESYDISGDESYLLMKGKMLFLEGNVDGAYKVYRCIKDTELLKEAGVNLKDMERKWPFVAIRGLKNLWKKGDKSHD